MNLIAFGLLVAYDVDSRTVMATSVFLTIRINMTKMVWSQGGHIKQLLLYISSSLIFIDSVTYGNNILAFSSKLFFQPFKKAQVRHNVKCLQNAVWYHFSENSYRKHLHVLRAVVLKANGNSIAYS